MSSSDFSDDDYDCDFYDAAIKKTKDTLKTSDKDSRKSLAPSKVIDLDPSDDEFDGKRSKVNKRKSTFASLAKPGKVKKTGDTTLSDDDSYLLNTPGKDSSQNSTPDKEVSINVTPPGSPAARRGLTSPNDLSCDFTPSPGSSRTTRSGAKRGRGRGRGRGAILITPVATKMDKKTTKALRVIGAQKAKSTRTANALNYLDKENDRSLSGRGHQLEVDSDLESGNEEDESILLKVQWRHEIVRIKACHHKPLSHFFKVASEKLGQAENSLIFKKDETVLADTDYLQSHNIGITSIITAVIKPKDQSKVKEKVTTASSDKIEVICRTKDLRSEVKVILLPGDSMKTLVEKYAKMKKMRSWKKLKFMFDGEALDMDETVETLDLEGGECFDVY